jgi:hypothetical protein
MRLPKTYGSDEEARQAATLLDEGVYTARITEAVQKRDQYKREMIEARSNETPTHKRTNHEHRRPCERYRARP